jgi:ubiquinone/menaquinone biosynthesis C-methylase UbiE
MNSNEIKKNYEIISNTYDNIYYQKNNDNEKIKEIIKKVVEKNHPKSVVELGCGTGYWLEFIATNFEIEKIIGFDFSTNMLKKAKEKKGNFTVKKLLLPDDFQFSDKILL